MVGLHSSHDKTGYRKDVCEEDFWKLAAAQYGNGIGYGFFSDKKKELIHLAYTIQDGFHDHNTASSCPSIQPDA